MDPPAPATQPVVEEMKERVKRSLTVGAVMMIHVDPPSVVFRTRPDSPIANAVVVEVYWIPNNCSFMPATVGSTCQVAPPLDVRMIVPRSATAIALSR